MSTNIQYTKIGNCIWSYGRFRLIYTRKLTGRDENEAQMTEMETKVRK